MAAVYTTLAEAKAHCYIDWPDDDIMIAFLQELAEECVLDDIEGSKAGEGTVTTAGTTALVGTDSNFTDYTVGDTITVSGETTRTIDTITDDNNLTISTAFAGSISGLSYIMHAGFPDPLPKKLRQSMLMYIKHFYDNRDLILIGVGASEIPIGIRYLESTHKNWTIA